MNLLLSPQLQLRFSPFSLFFSKQDEAAEARERRRGQGTGSPFNTVLVDDAPSNSRFLALSPAAVYSVIFSGLCATEILLPHSFKNCWDLKQRGMCF